MVQRGILGPGTFRISVPGINVNTARDDQFLLHEDHLFTQPYFSGWVPCPFAGDTSNSSLSQTVQVAIPNVTATPIVLLYPRSSDDRNAYPALRATGTSAGFQEWNIDGWRVYYEVVSATRIDVTFVKPSYSRLSPKGAYLVAQRRPS